MRSYRKQRVSGILSMTYAALLITPALITPAISNAAELEEIIVTATKRAEKAQDVPISILAFRGSDIEKSGIETLQDIQFLAPNLTIAQGNNVNNNRIIIRGVGSVGNSAIEPSVATFIDDVYIPRPGALLGDLFDVETIEVIRGPQGTLFGRNSTVGALNIHTRNPDQELAAATTLSYGSYNNVRIQGMVNVPISNKVSGRLVSIYSSRDGYADNLRPGEEGNIGGHENISLRGKLRIEPNENLDIVLSADYAHININGSILEILNSTVTPANTAGINFTTSGNGPDLTDTFDYKVNQRHLDSNKSDQYGLSMNLTWDIGEHSLKSISAYRDWNFTALTDPFRLNIDLLNITDIFKTETFSQEFQLLSPTGQFLEYVTGLYYYDEKFNIDTTRSLQPDFCNTLIRNILPRRVSIGCARGQQENAVVGNFFQHVKSYAVFGQTTLNFTEKFTATLGFRWTKDEKNGFFGSVTNNAVLASISTANEPGRALKFSDNRFTYRVSVNYRPTEDIMLYTTYNTGYKSGGFNSSISGRRPLTDEQRVFNSENVDNFEVGMKSSWLNRAVRANVAFYHTQINDFQARSFDGLGFITTNAGGIRQQGVEFEIQASPTDKLFVSLAGAYLDSKFTSFVNAPNFPGLPGVKDMTGQRGHFSPKWELAAVGQWTDFLPNSDNFEWFFRTEWSYRSEQNIGARLNQSPQTIQGAYSITNFRFGIGPEDRKWQLVGYVENAFSTGYCQTISVQVNDAILGVRDGAGNTLHRCSLGKPRTWGGQIKIKF